MNCEKRKLYERVSDIRSPHLTYFRRFLCAGFPLYEKMWKSSTGRVKNLREINFSKRKRSRFRQPGNLLKDTSQCSILQDIQVNRLKRYRSKEGIKNGKDIILIQQTQIDFWQNSFVPNQPDECTINLVKLARKSGNIQCIYSDGRTMNLHVQLGYIRQIL